MKTKFLAVMVVSMAAVSAFSQLTVTGAETNSLNTPIRSVGRTYMSGYQSTTLAGSTGPVLITGVKFMTTADPAGLDGGLLTTAVNFTDFTMVLGKPSTQFTSAGEFLNLTSTFASWANGLTTVRSGALSMGAGFWQLGQWTPTINFSTPFLFDKGTDPGLIFGFVHQGSGTTLDTTNFPAATRDFSNWSSGTGADAILLTSGAGFNATPGGFSSPVIVQFQTAPVPEPATMAVLGLGALALIRRRRTK